MSSRSRSGPGASFADELVRVPDRATVHLDPFHSFPLTDDSIHNEPEPNTKDRQKNRKALAG